MTERFSVTLIDVGWGDSILVESVESDETRHFGLIDCNDTENLRSSLIFVKRYFERMGIRYEVSKPNFDWVLLTHGHRDHAGGLKRMMQEFGTRQFWYPKSVPSTTYGNLLSFANASPDVEHHQAIDSGKILDSQVNFGPATMRVLWPPPDHIDEHNENNNSVVLALALGGVTLLTTGDAEADNWDELGGLPGGLAVFQVPHHGGRNGLFASDDSTPWLDQFPAGAELALSSHIRPHGHPHPDVVAAIQGIPSYRTDLHYHVTFTTPGTGRPVDVKYSRI